MPCWLNQPAGQRRARKLVRMKSWKMHVPAGRWRIGFLAIAAIAALGVLGISTLSAADESSLRFDATPRTDREADTSADAVNIRGVTYVAATHESGPTATARVFRVNVEANRLDALPDPTGSEIDGGAPVLISEFGDRPVLSSLTRASLSPELSQFDTTSGEWSTLPIDIPGGVRRHFISDMTSVAGELWVMFTRLGGRHEVKVASFDGEVWKLRGAPIRLRNSIPFFVDQSGRTPKLTIAYGAGRTASRAVFALKRSDWRRVTKRVRDSFGSSVSGAVGFGRSEFAIPVNQSLPAAAPWRFSLHVVRRRSGTTVRPAPLNLTTGDAQGGLWRGLDGSALAVWVEQRSKLATRNGVPGRLYTAVLSKPLRSVSKRKLLWSGRMGAFFALGAANVSDKSYAMFAIPHGAANQGSRLALISVDDPTRIVTY